MIFFDWDENKNQKNQVKHGISFDEAKTVFWVARKATKKEEERYVREI